MGKKKSRFATLMRVRNILLDEGDGYVYRKEPGGDRWMQFSRKQTVEKLNSRYQGLGATDGILAAICQEEGIRSNRVVGNASSMEKARAAKARQVDVAELMFDILQVLELCVDPDQFTPLMQKALTGEVLIETINMMHAPEADKRRLEEKVQMCRTRRRHMAHNH